jgi:ligand-binding sensor domain-containing protein
MRARTLYNAIHMAACILVMQACNGRTSASANGPGAEVRSIPAPPDTAQLSDYIVAAFEDSRGDLWFGTVGDGVIRYSPAPSFVPGDRLTYFTTNDGLADMVARSIVEDGQGHIWIGSHDGATRFDGVKFTAYKATEGLHGAGCVLLVDRTGTLWAGTNDGAFRFDGTRFQPFAIPTPRIAAPSHKWVTGKVWAIMEDSRGNIWFGRDGLGACRFDGRSFTHFSREDGLCSNNVAGMVEDPQGNIWFGCITSDFPPKREGGVARYDPSAAPFTGVKTMTQFPDVRGLTGSDVYNVFRDRAGNIWVAAMGVGAYRIDASTALGAGSPSFTLFDRTDRPDRTRNFAIQAFWEDRQGTQWFGFSGGLFRFDGRAFVNVTRGGPW